MDLDLGSFISLQISQITQSSTSRLGFPALITALCDIQGVTSDTLIFESLSPMINLAYIKKNYWTPADLSIIFPRTRHTRTRVAAPAPDAPPPSQVAPRPQVSTSAPSDMHSQTLRSVY